MFEKPIILARRGFLSAAATAGTFTALSMAGPVSAANAALETLPATSGYVPPTSLGTIYGAKVLLPKMPDGPGAKKVFERAFTSTTVAKAAYFRDANNKLKIAVGVVGKENQFQVVDAASGQNDLNSTPFSESAGGISSIKFHAKNSAVYALGNGALYKYTPGAQGLTKLGDAATNPYALSFDSKGRVWFGCYPKSEVFCYDPVINKTVIYPTVEATAKYIRSTAIIDDVMYVGTGTESPKIYAFHVDRPLERTAISIPAAGGTGFVFNLAAHGGKLVVSYEDAGLLAKTSIYDPVLKAWRDVAKTIYARLTASFGDDDKMYFVNKPNLTSPYSIIEMDLVRWTFTILAESPVSPNELSTEIVSGVRTLRLFGEDVAKENYRSVLFDLASRTITANTIVTLNDTAYKVQDFIVSKENKLYAGGYMGDGIASIDLTNGNRWRNGRGSAINQIEGMIEHNDTIYIGSYGSADLINFNKKTAVSTAIIRLRTEYGQSRPYGWAYAAGKIVAGTVPDYGLQGGALAIIDPLNDSVTVKDNLINRQSIVSLAGSGDTVYGTTSVKGGLGSQDDINPAVVFAYDVAKQTMLWKNTTLKSETAIYSPTIVGNRLFVAVANGIIELDLATGRPVATFVLFARTGVAGWRDVKMYYHTQSNSLVHRTGGTITAVNLKNNARTQLFNDAQGGTMKVASDGRIYAVSNSTNIAEIDPAFSPTVRSQGDIISISGGGGINFKKSNGAGGFATGVGIVSSGYSDAKSAHLVDWNNNGMFDILSNHKDGSLRVRMALREGGYSTEFTILQPVGSGWDKKRMTVGRWTSGLTLPEILAINPTGNLEQWRGTSTAGVILIKLMGDGWGSRDIGILDLRYDGKPGIVFREGAKMVWVPRDSSGNCSPTVTTRVEIATSGWSSATEFAVVTNHFRTYNGIVWKDTTETLRYTSNLKSQLLSGIQNYGYTLKGYRLGGTSK